MAILLIFAVLFFFLNLSYAGRTDYLLYSFKFSMAPQDGASWPLVHEKVGSLWDIIYSQYIHYLFVNGRTIVHAIIQVFTSFFRFDVCCAIVTFIYVITLILGEKVCFTHHRHTWIPYFVFIVAVFAFCCDPAATYGMETCVNYLWPITFVLGFIILFSKDLKWWGKVIFFLLAFVSGWSHEAIAIPVSVSLLAYMILERKSIKSFQVAGILLFFMGTVAIVFAPGNFVKFVQAQDTSSMMGLVVKHFSLFIYLRLTYVLLISLIYLASKKKLKCFVLKHKYWFIALVTSVAFIIFTSAINPRSTFFIEIIAGGLLCMFIDEFMSVKMHKVLIALFSLVIIPLFVGACFYRMQMKEKRLRAEEQIALSQDPIVSVDIERVNFPKVLSPFVGEGAQGAKPEYLNWIDIVYEFVYQKEEVNVTYVDKSGQQ